MNFTNYRVFYWFYDTLLKNIEANITNIKRIDNFCIEATNRKYYNIVHQAKIELSEIQYLKDIDTKKLFTDIRNDLHSINKRFKEVFKTNSLAYHCLKDIKFSFSQFEKWFTSITEPKPEPKPEPEKLPTLEAIFQDQNHLKKLVELLTERGFAKVQAGRLTWTGIENGSETDRGRGLQLVALSKVCKPLYKTEVFTAKDLNQAWTKSFNYKMSAVKWQAGEVEKISDSYLRLFTFINHSFRIK